MGDEEDATGSPEVSPLDLTVDRVELVHGAVRLSATMVDGSADVSVLLGDACDRREVGRGMATRSNLVWAFAESEIAEGLACDLVVVARVHTPAEVVVKELSLAVSPIVTAAEGAGAADDGPQLGNASCAAEGIQFSFTAVPRWARLSVGDSLVEATQTEAPDEEEQQPPDTAEFVATYPDFSRAVLTRRAVSLAGVSFPASLSLGGMALDEPTQGDQGGGATRDESAGSAPDESAGSTPDESAGSTPDDERDQPE
jgi:hypothetical protein